MPAVFDRTCIDKNEGVVTVWWAAPSSPSGGGRMVGRPAAFQFTEPEPCWRRDKNGRVFGQSNGPQSISALPPFGEPVAARLAASTKGCFFIGVITALLYLMPLGFDATPARDAGMILLGIQVSVATVSLLGVMLSDPGWLQRSPHTCFPLPAVVLERLCAGTGLDGLQNVIADYEQDDVHHQNVAGKEVFCVRCCIWRKAAATSSAFPTHHCSICQRCVADFNHHCPNLGRCIAGRGFGGNMGFYKVLLGTAASGLLTCFATIGVSGGSS